MAVEFYIESADRPAQSGLADEEITAGELVYDDGAGLVRADFADGDVSGVAEYSEEYLSAFDEDDVADETYDIGDRVAYGGNADGDVVKVRTAEDNGTDPAPSIGHRTVVGLLDDSSTVASASEFKGRLVEEGYTDNAATTYDRATGNFIAVGVAYRPAKQNGDTVDTYDTPVRVIRFGEVKEN